MKKKLKQFAVTLAIGAVSIFGYKFATKPSGPKVYESSVLSTAMITLSNSIPDLKKLVIMDERSFMPDVGLFENYYVEKQIRNVERTTKNINILVDSSGGSTDKMFEILNYTKALQKRGYKFVCYVAKAMSAAFTFTLTGCDKIVLIKGGEMMQHKAFYASQDNSIKVLTADTELLSTEMAKKEFNRVKKLSFTEYYEMTRDGADDKYFSESELLKYGIIDGVLE